MMKRDLRICGAAYLLLMAIAGCSINTVELRRPDLIEKDKAVFVYGHDDVASINKAVKDNMTGMGFKLVQEKTEADLFVDYNYRCRFDVIHYTCKNFNLFITDKKSNEIAVQAKFWADTPFSAETLINNLFEKLQKELQNKSTSTAKEEAR